MSSISKRYGGLVLSYVNKFTKFFSIFLMVSYNLLHTLNEEEKSP